MLQDSLKLIILIYFPNIIVMLSISHIEQFTSFVHIFISLELQ